MDKSPQTIRPMFAQIADSYDRANSLLSLGIHHLWKKALVNQTPVGEGDGVLDCATGTGDLALLFKKKVGSGQVIGIDFCPEMLEKGPQKAAKAHLDISFQRADVTKLPFKDDQFKACSLSFGIRNVEDREAAYEEMARVTQKGGTVMILEFGQIQTPGLKQLYDFYGQKILPLMGGLVSGKPQAYQYLNDSSKVFPCGEEFKQELMATGLYKEVTATPLSLGLTYIYKCQL